MRYTFKEVHEIVTKAYLKAREHERSTEAQIEFEINLEYNLNTLTRELYNREWYPQPLDWFINLYPTVREVFAPKFKDRIVSHVLYILISPIFERYFVYDSFSCRIGKGTLVGIERLEHHIRSITRNYTREAYSLNYDISAYFMSINRSILLDMILVTLEKFRYKFPNFIDYDFAIDLITVFLTRDPLLNCVYHGNPKLTKLIPPGKSLWDQKPGTGIPIGDVLNQLCSNIYLTPFDHFILRELYIHNAVRYVDDGKMLHTSEIYLQECKEKSNEFLNNVLHLHLHPNKTTITNLNDVTYFLGAAIKPYRRHVKNDVIVRFKEYIMNLNDTIMLDEFDTKKILSNINARLGYLSHFDEKSMIKDVLFNAPNLLKYYSFTNNFKKAVIKN